MKALVTGSAGFIGYHLSQRLVADGFDVIGIDNLNNYYDVRLKYGRLESAGFEPDRIAYGLTVHSRSGNQTFVQLDLTDGEGLHDLFRRESFDIVCNLAAQPGVRYSIENPYTYISSNIEGFLNVLEGCRHYGPDVLCYASSSSVYGLNSKIPFSEKAATDEPASIYAATKKSNELMVSTYAHLYGLRAIGLRFFTVYGPWGRPDMAVFSFTKNVLSERPITLYNNGNMRRDFTYIDDIVEGMVRVLTGLISEKEDAQGIYNVGRGEAVGLIDFVREIERATGKKAILQYEPMQPGDIEETWADTTALQRDFGYTPAVALPEGIERFVRWYTSWISK